MTLTLEHKSALVTNSVAIKDSITAFNKGDLNQAVDHYAENAEVVDPTGKYVGRSQILASQKVWQTAFPDAKGEVTNQIAEGEQVLTEATFRGTHTGPLAGPNGMTVPATNKKIDMHLAFIDLFKDGKIQRERAYFDLAGLMQQLGLSPNGR
jgi:steroid delta-isomerase-like uncharacterized protein